MTSGQTDEVPESGAGIPPAAWPSPLGIRLQRLADLLADSGSSEWAFWAGVRGRRGRQHRAGVTGLEHPTEGLGVHPVGPHAEGRKAWRAPGGTQGQPPFPAALTARSEEPKKRRQWAGVRGKRRGRLPVRLDLRGRRGRPGA